MATVSTEKLSKEYLQVNNCGCEHIVNIPAGKSIQRGRIDHLLLYITEGYCYITENKRKIKVEAGSIIYYPPHVPQIYEFTPEVSATSYFLHFAGTGAEEIAKKINIAHQRIIKIGVVEAIEKVYNKVISEFNFEGIYHREITAAYLMQLLFLIGKEYSYAGERSKYKHNKIIESARNFIHQNLKGTPSIGELAALCYLSEDRFTHLFKDVTGLSPKQYITNAKISKAKNLLWSTDLSVKEIGAMVGIENQNYFSRLFRANTGYTPTQYRQKDIHF